MDKHIIGVIADDFTGAAEVAGVGLRYGLAPEVQTAFFRDCDARLLVLDTDSRSCSQNRAVGLVTEAARLLKDAGCDWIYKKVDSAMRGNIAAELQALISELNRRRVLLVPANPSLGRTISNGRYFIDGCPIQETDFAQDPEYPATSSDVLELLAWPESTPARVLSADQPLPADGVIIGQTQTKDDLSAWAARLDPYTIAAGGAEFFAAILEETGFKTEPHDMPDKPQHPAKALFVCGGSSRYSREAISRAAQRGVPVITLPPELAGNGGTDELLARWSSQVATALEKSPCAVLAVNQAVRQNAAAKQLSQRIADLVDRIVRLRPLDQLYVEGGATASAIVRRLKWTRFIPRHELVPGVVTMTVLHKQDQYLTVKPGSYPWPESLFSTVV